MLIIPGVDLLEGRCVRLHQGRFDRVTAYSEDPGAVARTFVEQGARALHVVDLEGARSGDAKNLGAIATMRAAVPVFVQVGGGIRTFALGCQLLDAGVDRVVLGTAVAEDPGLARRLIDRYGRERVGASLDLRDGRVAVRGWQAESCRSLPELLADLGAAGVRWVVVTDVTRDGTLGGPSLDGAEHVVRQGFEVIVAGGVAAPEHVARVRRIGAAGCIIGTALYEGRLTLAEAVGAAGAD